MNLVVKGKNIDVTPSLREYVEKKMARLERYSHHIVETSVELSHQNNPRIPENQIVEITVSVTGQVLRAEEAHTDMYAAIDLAGEKAERQLKKYEEKRFSDHSGRVKTGVAMAASEESEEEEEEASV